MDDGLGFVAHQQVLGDLASVSVGGTPQLIDLRTGRIVAAWPTD